ncbi:hypothetical protein PIB30_090250 [Stylosanthes scabra]|uniref:Uncharacterized protein n=1 Tax=Stylosanthes scabra TaxID=79078 RepID=A0ABU6YX05_9FABA|nr:hypothetical protein [Stylosanthes scabra]
MLGSGIGRRIRDMENNGIANRRVRRSNCELTTRMLVPRGVGISMDLPQTLILFIREVGFGDPLEIRSMVFDAPLL